MLHVGPAGECTACVDRCINKGGPQEMAQLTSLFTSLTPYLMQQGFLDLRSVHGLYAKFVHELVGSSHHCPDVICNSGNPVESHQIDVAEGHANVAEPRLSETGFSHTRTYACKPM